MSELPQDAQVSPITYYSKTNLRAKCRYRYHNDRSQSIKMIRGEVIHLLAASYLSGIPIEEKDVAQICDAHGLTKALVGDVFTTFLQWKRNKGDLILKEKEIISIESNDAVDFKYGKKITRVKIDETRGLQGMFDLVCVDKKTGTFEVMDWKSGMVPRDDVTENIINGLLAYLYYNLESVFSSVYSIPNNYAEKFVVNKINYPDCIKMVNDMITAVVVAEADGIKKTVNQYCSYCSLKSECDEYKQLLVSNPPVFVPADINGGMDEMARLKVIESAVHSESEAISDMCKHKLEQEQNDKYELVEDTRYEYPAQEVYNTLSDMGYKPDGILKINKTDLDDFLNEIRLKDGNEVFKTVKEIISALKQEKTKSRRIRKKQLITS